MLNKQTLTAAGVTFGICASVTAAILVMSRGDEQASLPIHAELTQAIRDQGFTCDRVLGQDKAIIACREGQHGLAVYRVTGRTDERLERIE